MLRKWNAQKRSGCVTTHRLIKKGNKGILKRNESKKGGLLEKGGYIPSTSYATLLKELKVECHQWGLSVTRSWEEVITGLRSSHSMGSSFENLPPNCSFHGVCFGSFRKNWLKMNYTFKT